MGRVWNILNWFELTQINADQCWTSIMIMRSSRFIQVRPDPAPLWYIVNGCFLPVQKEDGRLDRLVHSCPSLSPMPYAMIVWKRRRTSSKMYSICSGFGLPRSCPLLIFLKQEKGCIWGWRRGIGCKECEQTECRLVWPPPHPGIRLGINVHIHKYDAAVPPARQLTSSSANSRLRPVRTSWGRSEIRRRLVRGILQLCKLVSLPKLKTQKLYKMMKSLTDIIIFGSIWQISHKPIINITFLLPQL